MLAKKQVLVEIEFSQDERFLLGDVLEDGSNKGPYPSYPGSQFSSREVRVQDALLSFQKALHCRNVFAHDRVGIRHLWKAGRIDLGKGRHILARPGRLRLAFRRIRLREARLF